MFAVQALIVEKHETRQMAPKAHAIGPRSLDIHRQAGLDIFKLRAAGALRQDSLSVGMVTTLAGEELQSFPYERMDADVPDFTPEMFHNVPQPEVEKQLRDQIEGLVEIRRGHSFVRCTSTEDGSVITVVENRSSGELYAIRSTHIIACDGAKSRV